MTTYKEKQISNILPSKMVEVFEKNTPLQAGILKKEFIGLWIEASGIIRMIEALDINYVTFLFNNEADGVSIMANFDLPIKKDLSVLKVGDKIKVKGQVFNMSTNSVILDHCELIHSNSNKKSSDIKNIYNINKSQVHLGVGDNIGRDKILKNPQDWFASYWVQIIAGLTLAGLLAVGGWYWNTIRQDILKAGLSDKNRTAEETKIIDSSVFRLATKTDYSEPLLKTQQRWQAYSGLKTKERKKKVSGTVNLV